MENVTLVAANSMKRPTPSLARFDKPGPKTSSTTNVSLQTKLLSAGLAACFADLMTFPLDTAKVRLQIQGEGPVPNTGSVGGAVNSAAAATTNKPAKYRGVVGTICTISRHEGPKALYSGLCPGLQRQMCFASIRIGLYDNVKRFYMDLFQANSAGNPHVGLRILAGVTTGGMAVACAQPTDVVKVRFQAQAAGVRRYKGVLQAYRTIAVQEGIRGLWKGTSANIARNGVVNATELVSYDLIKEKILLLGLLSDNMPCHFVSGVGAGFCTTLLASPIDVVKTRFMNSGAGTYSGVANCAVTMFKAEGATAFYKGFWPSFMRLGTWNIVMFVCFEQLKRQFSGATGAVQPPQIPQLPINISQGPSRYI